MTFIQILDEIKNKTIFNIQTRFMYKPKLILNYLNNDTSLMTPSLTSSRFSAFRNEEQHSYHHTHLLSPLFIHLQS